MRPEWVVGGASGRIRQEGQTRFANWSRTPISSHPIRPIEIGFVEAR